MRRGMIVVAVLAALAGMAGAGDHVELVLDDSVAMWKRLDDSHFGVVAARAVLTALMYRLPADPRDLNIGLRVVGGQVGFLDNHACEDTALLVPVDGFDRASLLGVIDETRARGAGPVARSLLEAGDDLAGRTGSRLVVLVTAGGGWCGGELEVAALRLQEEGIDLAIVGVHLGSADLNRYWSLAPVENAPSTPQLADAVDRALEDVVRPSNEPQLVTVRVEGIAESGQAFVALSNQVTGLDHVYMTHGDAIVAEVPAGRYNGVLSDGASAVRMFTAIDVVRGEEVDLAFTFDAPGGVHLEVGPEEVAAGGVVTARFEGAPQGGGWVAIGPSSCADGVETDRRQVDGGDGEVRLATPDLGLDLEARYMVSGPGQGYAVVGRVAFRTKVIPASVEADEELVAGTRFEMRWEGPEHAGDFVTIVPKGAPSGAHLAWAPISAGSPVELVAPIGDGAHEVRYVSGWSGRWLAHQSVLVKAPEARLKADSEVVARTAIEVVWEGPDAQGDYVTMVPDGTPEGEYLEWASTADGNPVTLTAPPEPGAYEVRYVSGDGDRTLGRTLVSVLGIEVSLDAPPDVDGGLRFAVSWTGPNGPGDYVAIAPEGSREGRYLDWAYTTAGSALTLAAPRKSGVYEVRYVRGRDARTLARVVVNVR